MSRPASTRKPQERVKGGGIWLKGDVHDLINQCQKQLTKELGFEPTKAQVVEHLARRFLGAT